MSDMNGCARSWAHLFAGAAALLLPWIVYLAVAQQRAGVADRLPWIHVGMVAAILIGSTVTAVGRLPRVAIATATLALVTAWFFGVTEADEPGLPMAVIAIAVAILVATATAAVGVVLPLTAARRPGSVARSALLVLVVLQILILVRAAELTPSHRPVDHLRTAWVGLDLAEALTLGLLATALRTGHRWSAAVGSATATLLFVDAFINTVTVSGTAQLEAAAMALIELTLATAALVVPWACARALQGTRRIQE